MLIGPEFAVGMRALALPNTGTMVTINAILHLTILPVGTGIEPRQERDGRPLLLARLVFVFETTGIALCARPPEVMVVAQLFPIFALFDAIQNILVYLDGRIQPARAGAPLLRLGARRDAHRLRRAHLRQKRQNNGGRGAGI